MVGKFTHTKRKAIVKRKPIKKVTIARLSRDGRIVPAGAPRRSRRLGRTELIRRGRR